MTRSISLLAAIALPAIFSVSAFAAQNNATDFTPAEKQFEQTCQACHGQGAAGGDRAPALTNNRALRSLTETQIADIIKSGTPGGMPSFPLPDNQLHLMASWVRSLNISAFDAHPEGDAAAGEKTFFGDGKCATCHMVRGRGASNGPDLSDIGKQSTVHELDLILNNPTSQIGIHTTSTCPSYAFCPDEEWRVARRSSSEWSNVAWLHAQSRRTRCSIADFRWQDASSEWTQNIQGLPTRLSHTCRRFRGVRHNTVIWSPT